jgi:hypothetical protein
MYYLRLSDDEIIEGRDHRKRVLHAVLPEEDAKEK